MNEKTLSPEQANEILKVLKTRFEKNMNRHLDMDWSKIQQKLESNPDKLYVLNEMENTDGEPDVIAYYKNTWEYIFCDCAQESPKSRRSLCYDREALETRKEFKPKNTVVDMAREIWIELLNEEEYRELQKLGNFDLKTSSWLKTPEKIRKLWWAIFADRRYDTVFVYHNWAESYYAVRWFRGLLRV